MRISDPRYVRDRARYDLAYRMLLHGARPGTVCTWSGLSEYQIETLSRAYCRSEEKHRGNSPTDLRWFWRTPKREQHASILAALCRVAGVLPAAPCKSIGELSSLPRGWQLCYAYQAYIDCVTQPDISFEYANLLAFSLSRQDTLSIGRCTRCDAALLIDSLAGRDHQCGYCRGRLPGPARDLRQEHVRSRSDTETESMCNVAQTAPKRRKTIRHQRNLFA